MYIKFKIKIVVLVLLGLLLLSSLSVLAETSQAPQASLATQQKIKNTHSTQNQEKNSLYSGEPLSLQFQDIELRAVLQIIADFSNFNLIVCDSVKGNLTLRLENVPWDQALDSILKSKGLDKRHLGNVMIVGPYEEIAIREKQALENQKQTEEMGLLKSKLISIQYAKADELAAMLKDQSNSLMTSRGHVSADKRTNALLIQDTDQKLSEISQLIKKLDVPIRQVEISTQIITADNTLEEALGVRFGAMACVPLGPPLPLNLGNLQDAAVASFPPPHSPHAHHAKHLTEGLFSDLSSSTVGAGVAKLGFSLARLPNNTFIDLELQALEYEAKIRTISRPKLMTVDQNKASVETGVEIPYQESTASGAASVAFKKAVLRLEVTPQITPSDKILLDLTISNDSQGSLTTQNTGPFGTSGAVSINTNKLQTKVLANDGETIVLGGVLTTTDHCSQAKVPILGDIPLLGALFKNKYENERGKELLIFITPRIVSGTLCCEQP